MVDRMAAGGGVVDPGGGERVIGMLVSKNDAGCTPSVKLAVDVFILSIKDAYRPFVLIKQFGNRLSFRPGLGMKNAGFKAVTRFGESCAEGVEDIHGMRWHTVERIRAEQDNPPFRFFFC